jgi:hypothetical protein
MLAGNLTSGAVVPVEDDVSVAAVGAAASK